MVVDGIEIKVERKAIKTIRLRVKPDGSVYVSAPRLVGKKELEDFVRDNLDWLRDKLKKAAESASKRELSDGDEVLLLGERYNLKLEAGEGERFSVEINDRDIILHTPRDSSAEQRQRAIDELLYRKAIKKLAHSFAQKWEPVMQVHALEWRTKLMKTRWGSCNTKQARIWLNVRLAAKRPECIEYVAVHELCHLLEPSHNARFHSLMTKFLPDWKKRKAILNEKEA